MNIDLSDGVRWPPGLTVWFTGLSSSGKTTISAATYEILVAEGYRVERLDGDIVRRNLSQDLGFGKKDRDENVRRIGLLAKQLTRDGAIVLVAAISPYRAARNQVRHQIGNFLEVFVCAPLGVCEQRDVKGIYRKARAGTLCNVTGIDDPYEPPIHPDLTCYTEHETPPESAARVYQLIQSWFASKRAPSKERPGTSIEYRCQE